MDELINLAAKRLVRTTTYTVATALVVWLLSVAGGTVWADPPSDTDTHCPMQGQQPPTQPPLHHDIKPIPHAQREPVMLVLLCGSQAHDTPVTHNDTVAAGPNPGEHKVINPLPTPALPGPNVDPPVRSSDATTNAASPHLTVTEIVAAVAALAAIAAIVSLILAWNPRDGDDQIWFRRHWGGFGSASTGWGMSASLMRLVIAMALAVMATVLLLASLPASPSKDAPSTDSKTLSAPAAAPTTPASPAVHPDAAAPPATSAAADVHRTSS
jgi:hypothetical protein